MVRALNDAQARRIAAGQVPMAFAVSTGDNCDNQQANELDWFIDAMDGSATLSPNSGGSTYEGVQAPTWGDRSFWLPRADLDDDYKVRGFPGENAWGFARDGFLAAALTPFATPPLAMPWYVAYGNHDGLLQGNIPANSVLEGIALGALKVAGPPPGFNPCDGFASLRADPLQLLLAPAKLVTADPRRRVARRAARVHRSPRRARLHQGPRRGRHRVLRRRRRARLPADHARHREPGRVRRGVDRAGPVQLVGAATADRG